MEHDITNGSRHESTDNGSGQELDTDDLDHASGGGETAYNAGKAVGDAIEDAWDWCVDTVSGWFD